MKRYSCIKINQGDFTMVSFVAKAKELFDLVKINRREENKREGYQRALNNRRVSNIAKFVDERNALPTNIVLALDSAKARLSANQSQITIDESGDAGWVIDGQHRLAGAQEADLEIDLAVTAFIGLSSEEQIQQFITINKEAQRVATSLYLDLLPDLADARKTDSEKAKERAVDISLQMRADENSPFFNRIVSLRAPAKGQISLTNFVRKIAPLVQRTGGVLRPFSIEVQRKMLDNYFGALQQVFPKEFSKNDSIFFKTLGFGAFLNSFQTVYDVTIARTTNDFSLVEVIKTMEIAETLDFEMFKRVGSGNQAETTMGKFISELIHDPGSHGSGPNIKV